MATPRYLPVATFKQWWKDDTSADDSLVEAAINAAETAIDNALGRKMIVVTSGAPGLTARMYAPRHRDVVFIHDCTEVSAVSDNGATVTSAEYQLEPLNGLSDAGESMPYTAIRRLTGWWSRDFQNPNKATLSITARYGWATIPYEVIESCKIVTADMLSNRDMRNGLVAITEAGGVGSRENMTVRNMVARYRSQRSWGIA